MEKLADGGMGASHKGTSNPVEGSSPGGMDDRGGKIGELDLREEAAEFRCEIEIERGNTVLDHFEPF
jgi:hypothetical protein